MNAVFEKSRRKIHGVMFKLPGMIACNQFEDFILAYLDDELPPGQRRLFKMHLLVCPSCQRYLSDYRRTLEMTADLRAEDALKVNAVPQDLIVAILATCAEVKP